MAGAGQPMSQPVQFGTEREMTMRPDRPADVAAAIRAALGAAEDAAHVAGCAPGSCAHVTQAAVVAFLRALPDRFAMPRPGGVSWGHAVGEMERLAQMVEVAHG